jgi:hypothetical protein
MTMTMDIAGARDRIAADPTGMPAELAAECRRACRPLQFADN